MKRKLLAAVFLFSMIAMTAYSAEYHADPVTDRHVLTQTAFTNTHSRRFNFSSYNILFLGLSYDINENFSFGVNAIPPIGFVFGSAYLRYATEVGQNKYFAVKAWGGGFDFLLDDNSDLPVLDETFYTFGITPTLTLGNRQKSISFSLINVGGSFDGDWEYTIFPTIAGSYQLAPGLKINGELASANNDGEYGRAYLINLALRIFGERSKAYMDAGLIASLSFGSDTTDNELVPSLHLGLRF